MDSQLNIVAKSDAILTLVEITKILVYILLKGIKIEYQYISTNYK